MIIAIIPARGGSKRIPRKNIKFFAGKPIIARAIATALKSKLFDKVFVSTDDDEIATISRKYGAETPFIRPKDLSDDFTTTVDVIAHAVNWSLSKKLNVKQICCIYPTSPFLEPYDLIKGQQTLSSGEWSYVISANEYRSSIFRSFIQDDNKGIKMIFPERFNTRTQDLPVSLHDASQFYWGNKDTWLNKKIFFDKYSFPQIIPSWRVHDIDTEDDWIRAELIFKSLERLKFKEK